jgi:hypothetical protein
MTYDKNDQMEGQKMPDGGLARQRHCKGRSKIKVMIEVEGTRGGIGGEVGILRVIVRTGRERCG